MEKLYIIYEVAVAEGLFLKRIQGQAQFLIKKLFHCNKLLKIESKIGLIIISKIPQRLFIYMKIELYVYKK